MPKPPNTTIIGLVGNHGSGKSTLTSILQMDLSLTQPGTQVLHLSFADPIRQRLNSILPVPLTRTKQHPYEREALVFLGEMWRRQDPDFFVTALHNKIKTEQLPYTKTIVLVDDVYHFNERDACDLVFYFQNTQYQEPSGYRPLSVAQTQEMLAEAAIVTPDRYFPLQDPRELDNLYPFVYSQVALFLKEQTHAA
jgi:energy-coupling factor transporter ATP-binding protein EcfA2